MSVIGRHKTEVETPALLLDMDAVERNIAAMASLFEGSACGLRPHYKTHKLPLIARKQLDAGAVGITCAKLDEAEALLQAGIRDVLIANQIVGDGRIRKLVNLSRYGDLIMCVDDLGNAQDISNAAGEIGLKMSVLIEVNIGLNRCGVRPGKPSLEFTRRLTELPNIVFRGLMGYEGALFLEDPEEKLIRCRESNALLVDTARLIEQELCPVEIVSSGGTNTCLLTGMYPDITDVQVGSYVTMDTNNARFGMEFEHALSVLTTVISRPERDRAVVDAGRKALSSDAGLPVFSASGLHITVMCEEHSIVSVSPEANELRIGDRLEVIPNHGCTTIPLYDRYVITRSDRVESVAYLRPRQAL